MFTKRRATVKSLVWTLLRQQIISILITSVGKIKESFGTAKNQHQVQNITELAKSILKLSKSGKVKLTIHHCVRFAFIVRNVIFYFNICLIFSTAEDCPQWPHQERFLEDGRSWIGRDTGHGGEKAIQVRLGLFPSLWGMRWHHDQVLGKDFSSRSPALRRQSGNRCTLLWTIFQVCTRVRYWACEGIW